MYCAVLCTVLGIESILHTQNNNQYSIVLIIALLHIKKSIETLVWLLTAYSNPIILTFSFDTTSWIGQSKYWITFERFLYSIHGVLYSCRCCFFLLQAIHESAATINYLFYIVIAHYLEVIRGIGYIRMVNVINVKLYSTKMYNG